MSRYRKLGDWLDAQNRDRIELGFSEIERIIGAPLPSSAARYHAFWSTGNHLGRILKETGWRAKPDLGRRVVEFNRGAVRPPKAVGDVRGTRQAKPSEPSIDAPDLVLVGCVKTKRSGRHPARDLYTSPLFLRRRTRAEEVGRPWFILSAKYGLVSPDEPIDSYELALSDLPTAERRAWAARVLAELERAYGPLRDKVVEVHAGSNYLHFGLLEGLRERGARVIVPLQGLTLGQQLAWYAGRRGGRGDREVAARPITATDREIGAVTERLTRDFAEGCLDLSARPRAPAPGWEAMPEFVAARRLQTWGVNPPRLRVFLTLVATLDRARDADRLWKTATDLYKTSPWVFEPEEIQRRTLLELRRCLAGMGVSQRHTVDTAAWKLIAEALICPDAPRAVREAVWRGEGDACELLEAVEAQDEAGQPWFPYLSGPKVSVMWVRMLAAPGGATIRHLETVPVAVDVQVRKVTENLGIAHTQGRPLEEVRSTIQDAWRRGASRALGPAGLAGTSAAVDPAVWFFGKWGCSFCERLGHRAPVSDICQRCRFPG